jgi:hypothetical protein
MAIGTKIDGPKSSYDIVINAHNQRNKDSSRKLARGKPLILGLLGREAVTVFKVSNWRPFGMYEEK